MTNAIEEAVTEHIKQNSNATLQNLYRAMLSNDLVVPLLADPKTDGLGRSHLPVKCIRFSNGEGGLPIFTSTERLVEWDRAAPKYTRLSGRAIFEMAVGMPEVDVVLVNYSQQAHSPKGRIMRPEFEMLARGH